MVDDEIMAVLVAEIEKSGSPKMEFLLCTKYIQCALDKGQTKKWIWDFLKNKGKFSGSYSFFLKCCKEFKLKKRPQSTIQNSDKNDDVSKFFGK